RSSTQYSRRRATQRLARWNRTADSLPRSSRKPSGHKSRTPSAVLSYGCKFVDSPMKALLTWLGPHHEKRRCIRIPNSACRRQCTGGDSPQNDSGGSWIYSRDGAERRGSLGNFSEATVRCSGDGSAHGRDGWCGINSPHKHDGFTGGDHSSLGFHRLSRHDVSIDGRGRTDQQEQQGSPGTAASGAEAFHPAATTQGRVAGQSTGREKFIRRLIAAAVVCASLATAGLLPAAPARTKKSS